MVENIHVICFGEILWDNLIQGRQIGGAPFNVCYHLHKNGIPGSLISQVGRDTNGEALLEAAQALGVDTDFINMSADYPTSTVEVQLSDNGEVAYDIVENVAWDYIEFAPLIATAVKDAKAFVYGSLAARNAVSRDTLLAYLALAHWKIFDVNLREPFFHKEIILELAGYCNTLKINEDELYTISGWLGVANQTEQAVVDGLFKAYPHLSEIILTKGAEGACYFDRTSKVAINGLRVDSVSTVGCGDSFLAGFLAYRIRGKSVEEAMRHATALSAFVVTQAGACPAYREEQIYHR